jgi:hypothetical protein
MGGQHAGSGPCAQLDSAALGVAATVYRNETAGERPEARTPVEVTATEFPG